MITHTIAQLRQLVEFVEGYPLPAEVRERMTYRQFHALVEAKMDELGLNFGAWDDAFTNHPDIRHWMDMFGMAMDERELMAEDHHMDLPLNFHWMEEYAPLREAEQAFWDRQPPGLVDTAPLLEIVRQFAPNPIAH